MLNALKDVGKTYNIQIVATYPDDATVHVTVLLSTKSEIKGGAKPQKPLVVEGPIAEVETYLAANIGKDVARTAELTTSITALEEEAEEAGRKASNAKIKADAPKKTDAKKPAEKPAAAAKPAAPAKKITETKPGFTKKKPDEPGAIAGTGPDGKTEAPPPAAAPEESAATEAATTAGDEDLFAQMEQLATAGEEKKGGE